MRRKLIALLVITGAMQVAPARIVGAQSRPRNAGTATITFEEPLEARGPVWVHIHLPVARYVQYPVGIVPDDFGCSEFEVRRKGVRLPRRPPRIRRPVAHVGLLCGSIGIPNRPMTHPDRLPLHLQFDLDSPGTYEVRYSYTSGMRGLGSPEVLFQSAWTPVELRPASSKKLGVFILPQDPVEILSDFLPSILGYPDSERLSIVAQYLYHRVGTVRNYAAYALDYWSADDVTRELTDLAQMRGPTDVVAGELLSTAPQLARTMMRYLGSNDPLLVQGALRATEEVLRDTPNRFSSDLKAEAESRLLTLAENVARVGDEQTITNLAAALGGVRAKASHDLLWDFVRRRVAFEQSLTAITWHKDLSDLPKLAPFLEGSAADSLARGLSSLPYALHQAYGVAALPGLEAAIKTSHNTWVRMACARELIPEQRPTGFAFVLDALEQNRFYKGELMDFLRTRFPQLRGASEEALISFVKSRSN
jgi:hypothetical protein